MRADNDYVMMMMIDQVDQWWEEDVSANSIHQSDPGSSESLEEGRPRVKLMSTKKKKELEPSELTISLQVDIVKEQNEVEKSEKRFWLFLSQKLSSKMSKIKSDKNVFRCWRKLKVEKVESRGN